MVPRYDVTSVICRYPIQICVQACTRSSSVFQHIAFGAASFTSGLTSLKTVHTDHIRRRQGSKSKANITITIVTLIMFSMSTTVMALNIATVIQEVRHWFILNPGLSLVDRERAASNYAARFDWVQDTLFSVEVR